MDYNSTREPLKLPEYGRNIQKMVEHAVSIEDKAERTKYTGHIIKVMGNLFPYLRDVAEFKQKLYDHLSIMSDFKLDIETEFVLPTSEALEVKVQPLAYPQSNIKLKHYGKKIEEIIAAAAKVEDDDQRKALSHLIANQMKRSFLMWNKKVVIDEKIYKDLKDISGGVLNYSDSDFRLLDLDPPQNQNRRQNNQNQNNNRRRK
jgi:hypothetical protein